MKREPNRFQTLLRDLDSAPALISKDEVRRLILKNLAGHHIHCSCRAIQAYDRFSLAVKTVQQFSNREEAVSVLMQKLGVSRVWAWKLINRAVNQKYEVATQSAGAV